VGVPQLRKNRKKVSIFCILYLLFSKNKTKLKLACGRAWARGHGHLGFKPWSPTREIWDVEVDLLCIGSQVSSALKARTPDMVAATFQDGLERQSAESKK